MNEINIICYSATELSTELCSKLSISGQKVELTVLSADTPLIVRPIEEDCSINAFVFCEKDMEMLGSSNWEQLPKRNTISKSHVVYVAFCVNCHEIPSSLFEHFIVKKVKDSAEGIRRELMQIHHLLFQRVKGRYDSFVGRNSEIEQFQNILYSERGSKTNALVVSGRAGVGREAFVRECIRQKKENGEYEPYTLSIGRNGNIELFLIQLNSICRVYKDSDFVRLLKGEIEEKVKASVKMLNDLFSDDDCLVLYDDGAACVRYNRTLSEWFKSIITDPMLKGGMHLYIISNVSVGYSRIKTEEDIAFITIYGLTLADRKKLLYRNLSNLSETASEDLIHFIADKLVYSPSQLEKVAEDIKLKSAKYVKDHIQEYQVVGDNRISSLINSYDTPEHPEAKNILVLMSKIEYVGKNILNAVYPDNKQEVDKEIDRFMADGIVERFGEWMDLVRLDSSISDYIRRNKISYSGKDMERHVRDVLSDLIESHHLLTEDYATYLYRLKRGIEQGRFDEESYLVPSVFVNTIVEAYDGKNWNQTIRLCEDVLTRHPNYFQEVYREIRYWYCLALARMQNEDKFYQQVRNFEGADLHFLKGFFLRIKREFAKAEAEYQKALSINPAMSKAKQEMVLVLQAQHKFSPALEMAQANYEKDPENVYFINAYFRCLVRKRDLAYNEKLLLKSFKDDPHHLFKARSFKEGMEFEYSRFIDRAKPEMLLLKASELSRKYGDAKYIQDIVNDYYASIGMGGHIIPVDYSEDFNF